MSATISNLVLAHNRAALGGSPPTVASSIPIQGPQSVRLMAVVSWIPGGAAPDALGKLALHAGSGSLWQYPLESPCTHQVVQSGPIPLAAGQQLVELRLGVEDGTSDCLLIVHSARLELIHGA